jgi:hypothetical protein
MPMGKRTRAKRSLGPRRRLPDKISRDVSTRVENQSRSRFESRDNRKMDASDPQRLRSERTFGPTAEAGHLIETVELRSGHFLMGPDCFNGT